MEGMPRLYETLGQMFSQPQHWVDRRHLKTLACMVAGLIQASNISLTALVPSVHRRATVAQSTTRRFTLGLEQTRVAVHARYGPLLQYASAEWGAHLGADLEYTPLPLQSLEPSPAFHLTPSQVWSNESLSNSRM